MEAKKTVLIVDDNRTIIAILNNILEPVYSTLVAMDGKMALKIAQTMRPDLILLDVIMPDISGFEVLAELKQSGVTRKIPVMFITGLDNAEEEERGLDMGAVDYITKPFHKAVVRARVKTQLQIAEYINTIEQLSMIDVVTNILNRRGFNERLNVEWRRSIREQQPLSILMIDIDRFKQYNDTYGHMQGDIALRSVAKILYNSLKRATDLVARFGGEEFVVLLPNTDLEGAVAVAEKMRTAVERTVIPETKTSVTISVGVNTQTASLGTTTNEFISDADKELYTAKNTSRNRVCYNTTVK